uniref:Uncharacterized protein n=1 Tax=Arundo donax TaxID=35708 RepID=A0A0A8ZWK4_ARUDO
MAAVPKSPPLRPDPSHLLPLRALPGSTRPPLPPIDPAPTLQPRPPLATVCLPPAGLRRQPLPTPLRTRALPKMGSRGSPRSF